MSTNPYDDPLNTLTGSPMASQAVATAYLGPPIVGFILHIALYGTVFSSALSYSGTDRYSRDGLYTKLSLWASVLVDTACFGVNCAEVYHYAISQRRDEASLFLILPMDALPPMLVGTIALFVQTYLARRASRIFQGSRVKRAIFLSVIGLFIVLSFVASVGATTLFLMYVVGKYEQALPFTFNNIAGTWMWISAAVDMAITLTLTIGLRTHIAGFSEDTDSTLRRLITMAWRTAAFTSIFGLGGAILGVAFPLSNIPTSDILMTFISPLASLYTLSLLVTLSTRNGYENGDSSSHPGTSRVITRPNATKFGARSERPLEVNVAVEMEVELSELSEKERVEQNERRMVTF
ncbi:hypothetical protein MNV49_004404 [Pseudohyphozyma bogoriensis]|nr:hypothetical protein MNV49_004404 [Pseudohyphozyma bogoriensis]